MWWVDWIGWMDVGEIEKGLYHCMGWLADMCASFFGGEWRELL